MRTIPLRGIKANGRAALVDDEDYDRVMQHKWQVREHHREGRLPYGPYAIANIRVDGQVQTVFMHNFVLDMRRVGHLNGLGLDNRRANLAPGASSQRRKGAGKSSQFKCVTWHNDKWQARIKLDGRWRPLGHFDQEVDAALAYDAAAQLHFGCHAKLNFPDVATTATKAAATAELAENIGPVWQPIRHPLSSLTLEEEANIIARYTGWESSNEIADAYGIWDSAVTAVLRRNGVTVRDMHDHSPVWHEAFDDLTSDAAYWCGLLFADGCVSTVPRRRHQVILQLTASDHRHVEKLRDFFGATKTTIGVVPAKRITGVHPEKKYVGRAMRRLAVCSDRLGERLLELGRYSGSLDPRLARSRDFWRGMVDGDGFLGISQGRAGLGLTGSARILAEFAAFVNLPGTRRPVHIRWTGTTHVVRTGCGTAERITEWLYADASVALDRKTRRATLIREHAATRVRRRTA